jgi:glycerate-2-kinase
MKIKNFDRLAFNSSRKKALQIVEAGLLAIDTQKIIKDTVVCKDGFISVSDNLYNIEGFTRVLVVGIGKSSFEAAQALEEIACDKIAGGIILDIKGGELKKIESLVGDHPLPSEKNIEHTQKIIKFLKSTEETDLVIFIISGGGSTLLCQPDKMVCHQESDLAENLFRKGATIYEINTIRKHLSLARGGNLAKYTYPAKVISLIFSDIPGDDLEFVASGPTYKDSTTVKDAEIILQKYGIQASDFKLIETPKDNKYFDRVSNLLISSSHKALEAMVKKARELEYEIELAPYTCHSCVTGEAEVVGKQIAKMIGQKPGKSALILGGETTVQITGKGRGGRNQELTLSALEELDQECTVISIASDGMDNCKYAGAIVDSQTRKKAQQLGLDIREYLDNNDSCSFFESTKDSILTGNTGSNVSDLIIALKE